MVTAVPSTTAKQSPPLTPAAVQNPRLPGAEESCSYGTESAPKSGTFITSEKVQRRTQEPARFGENRNDQCESSHGLPERRRTCSAGKRSRTAMARDARKRKRSVQADVAGPEPACGNVDHTCHGRHQRPVE